MNKNKTEFPHPMIYSLSHPLEEVSPIAVKSDMYHLIDDPLFQIVFTCENPSICVVFDGHTGQHSVYKIKRLPGTEWVENTSKSKNRTHSMFWSSSGKVGCNNSYGR